MGAGAKTFVSGIFYFGIPHGGSGSSSTPDSMTIEVGPGHKWASATVDLPSESIPYFSIVFTKSDGSIWHVFGCSELTIAGAAE
jgi:hypothetical protein